MLQHTNTYTTEKLYQYQQEQLKRGVNKALMIAEAEKAAEAEAEKQVSRKKGSMRRWLEKWRFVTSMK
ncbi:hypothetical protein [Paenibacillus silvisoli]|uniref:hypothetical protein n=1 Tax=Paenibacillus silvisoli TaxID=3110539 RepID=UPI0028064944|nr:hypothetical protein [Paenibacillus silvisoli]